MKDNDFYTVIFVAITFSVVISFIMCLYFISAHNEKYHQEPCDVGKPEVAGDYKINSNSFLARDCAIQDCVAFNKVHESIDGYDGMRCVV